MPPPIHPEDRRLLRGGADASSSEESDSSENSGEDIPGLGEPGTSNQEIFDNEKKIPNTPKYDVFVKKVPFQRQRRFKFEDTHFR